MKVVRAKWTDEAWKRLRREWWKGTVPAVIAATIEPMVGCLVSDHAVIVAAAGCKALRSPAALKRIRRAARLGPRQTKKVELVPEAAPTPKVVAVPPSAPIWRAPARPSVPYQGLATKGPDPLRELRIRMAGEGRRGAL